MVLEPGGCMVRRQREAHHVGVDGEDARVACGTRKEHRPEQVTCRITTCGRPHESNSYDY